MKFKTLVAGLCLLVCAAQARASVLNGSFEDSSDFPEPPTLQSVWKRFGRAEVKDNTILTPTQGTQQAFLSLVPEQGQQLIPLNAPDLESALGLTTDFLVDMSVITGSALSQQVSGNQGDELRFQWNFFTNEIPFTDPNCSTPPCPLLPLDTNDFAFVVFNGQFIKLRSADPTPSGPTIAGYIAGTGYTPSTAIGSFFLPATGSFSLAFGVVNVDLTGSGDPGGDSALAIDEVQLLTNPVTPVPEPASFMLLASGLLGLALYWRRARQ